LGSRGERLGATCGCWWWWSSRSERLHSTWCGWCRTPRRERLSAWCTWCLPRCEWLGSCCRREWLSSTRCSRRLPGRSERLGTARHWWPWREWLHHGARCARRSCCNWCEGLRPKSRGEGLSCSRCARCGPCSTCKCSNWCGGYPGCHVWGRRHPGCQVWGRRHSTGRWSHRDHPNVRSWSSGHHGQHDL